MNNDLISVVVTNYNHEEYIEECIRSVYNQEYRKIELLVFDDHSTDKSFEKIEEILKESPFETTKLYRNSENLGVCFNRNQAFDLIKGDFLLFLDSDNFLPVNYLSTMVTTAKQYEADIIYGNLINVTTNDYFMKSRAFDLKKLFVDNYIDNCSLLRVEKVGNARYDISLNRKKLEDYDFMLNLIINNQCKPHYDVQANLNYRVLSNSISRNEEHGTDKYYYEVYLEILTKYSNQCSEDILSAVKSNIYKLEGRLSELVAHLSQVSEYITELKDEKHRLEKEKIIIENNLSTELKNNLQLLREFENQNNELVFLKKQLVSLELDIQAIRISKSYRVGNFLVQPISKSTRFAKKMIKQKFFIKQIKNRVKRALIKIHRPNYYFLKIKRAKIRKQNNYKDPNRVLIYVIYPSSEGIQNYKLVFLEALSFLVKEIRIIVNGSLSSEDLKKVEQYGSVELRSNQGYDTAGFRQGILGLGKEKLADFDELLMINDTNVGPFGNLIAVFDKMASKKLDFWGITYGEEQPDFTGFNPYGYIPKHLQSYFLVIEKSMFQSEDFLNYWNNLKETDSREKAVGRHETTFTKYFEDLGYKHDAVISDASDSAMYIRPLDMLKEGSPLIKYAAFYNSDDDKFDWQGLKRESQIPELKKYIQKKESELSLIITEIEEDVKIRDNQKYVLIIDGVENAVPQLTKYRIENKVEQLESVGIKVKCVGLSDFRLLDAEFASHIIIYRAPYNELLVELCRLAAKYDKPILYDIDDLVFDTVYTNQLSYTKKLSTIEKSNYDASVINYGKMLNECNIGIATTQNLKNELLKYTDRVLINRNLASKNLVKISQECIGSIQRNETDIHIGYFSGSITHNENFELIKPAVLKVLQENRNVYLHLVGHLDIPKEFKALGEQLITHDFVAWKELPFLIAEVDINLAPLVNSVFNRAKSEIKWLEAGLLKIPTMASNVGSFSEMIVHNETGWLVNDDQWYDSLTTLITNEESRTKVSESVYSYVMDNCVTNGEEDELTIYLKQGGNYD